MIRAEIKKLDALWSKAVRSIGYCEKCGATSRLQAAHILSRRHRAVRWNPLNGVCLCYRCHIHWAHTDPVSFVRWLEEVKGSRLLDGLRLEAQRDVKGIDFETWKDGLECAA